MAFAETSPVVATGLEQPKLATMAKTLTKTKVGKHGGRKLASDAGRERRKSSGEEKEDPVSPRCAAKRNGASKQRKS